LSKGIEKRQCGCVLDHDKLIIDPCEDHVAIIMKKTIEDTGGRIDFAKMVD